MSSTNKVLSRRTVLRGAGALVALPFLDAMMPRSARAGTGSMTRYVVCYGGTAVGGSAHSVPAAGALSTLPRAWSSLGDVKSRVSILTGFTVPTYNTGETPPPGGRKQAQHGMIMAPMVSGVFSREAMPVQPIAHSKETPGIVGAHSVDQIVADEIGTETILESLQARVQVIGYGGGSGKGIFSGRMESSGPHALDPISSPEVLYTTLFAGVSSDDASSDTTTVSLQLRKQKSVLDLVLDDAKRLTADVGTADRARLEQHFDEIRELEERLLATTGVGGTPGGTCSVPNQPTDPSVGANSFGGWSDETLRGDLMADMIAMALACNITRVVSWMLTFDQCFMSSIAGAGVNDDVHYLSHNGTSENLADNANWHAARFGRLVQRLAELQEGTGSVLDSTFLTLLFAEGQNAHNSSNMHLVAAGCPSVLKMGQHIPVAGQHPARLLISGMQAIGMTQSTLGQISGPLDAIMV